MKAFRGTEVVELRDLFLLEPGVVFFNNGSFGACPRPVFEAYQSWQLDLERQPVAFMRRMGQELGAARQALAAYVGAQADDLVYVTNATMGINVVARSLRLEPGDEVLATDHEYGALDRAWRFNCQKSSAQYIRQPIPMPVESVDQVVEAIWTGVTERTRVLFFSHITSPTAFILPAEELVRRAREAGIITVIDGAHALGQIPLDMGELGADFYSGNAHKWMLSPKGSAFLYARREMQPLLEPLVVGWGWGNEKPTVSRFVDEQQSQGTRDPAAFLAVPTALRFMEEYNWPAVRQSCHELVCHARHELARFSGLAPLTPEGPEWFSQMATLPLPACDTTALWKHLHERYNVEIPVINWNGQQGVRLSAQGYNTLEDVETLIEGIREFYA